MNTQILLDDFERIANSSIPFDEFRNKSILITGGTGLIGSLCAKALLYVNDKRQLNLKVFVSIRSEDKAKTVYSDYLSNPSLNFVYWVSPDDLEIANHIDFIIHSAAETSSKQMIQDPLNVISLSVDGLRKVLEFALKNDSTVVYLSSMEMYGNPNLDRKVTEEDQGYIDLTNTRSCYPESKRMCECICSAYAAQKGLHVRVARLAQTFGAGVFASENRVFAQFAKSACKHEDIVLHTKGLSEGNYVYSSDAVTALLLLLLRGEDKQAYNIANEASHTTISDMAKMVAKEFSDGKSKVIFDIPSDNIYGYAADTKLFLSSEKIRNLGWTPSFDLKTSFERMIDYMKSDWMK
ncbi:NAD-dependent epimerase/dehydratase family protein [Succinivibrio dextrinosolvens]|uniref:NAD-dependent epimerase/dehydratase family protein n=1 Tax=Succinivibrio dextrinosolvens TaxID=83771 RepID=UPI001921430A|nr:NAD-dependent epimerase/dehydratase family protein [Succinivibrio dextrinosolvens]